MILKIACISWGIFLLILCIGGGGHDELNTASIITNIFLVGAVLRDEIRKGRAA